MNLEQRANLHKLAIFVAAGVPGGFDMMRFARNKYRESVSPQEAAECGTVCCFAGWGPAAGIAPMPNEDWWDYVDRAFGAADGSGAAHTVWNRLFVPTIADTDNTPAGAAQRAFDYLAEIEEVG